MTHSGEIGFLASALVLAAFGMKDMVNLRIVAICSNVAFIAYALVLNLPPVLVLHVILLPLNGWRLAQAFQSGHKAHELSERGWKAIEHTNQRLRQRTNMDRSGKWPRPGPALGISGIPRAICLPRWYSWWHRQMQTIIQRQ